MGRWLVPMLALVALVPGVSPAVALLLGAAVALAVGNPWGAATRRVQKVLLPAAVVGLGAAMDLGVVLRAGLEGFGYTLASIAATLVAGVLLARALRVEGNTGTLVSVGTAICGGSAIAAAGPAIGADEHEMTVSLGTVFLLNGLALLVFPAVGRWVGLDPGRFGLWAAIAIHDTSSVVGASMAYGGGALDVAVPVKLARALWIVPLVLLLGGWQARRARRQGTAPPRPWFILGFLAVAALVTYVPVLRPAGRVVAALARQAMVLTLFLVGAGLSREALRQVGARPLVLGVVLWVAVGVTALLGVGLS